MDPIIETGQQQSNKKSIIYIILLVLILLVVSGIWYVKQSKASMAFGYQDIVYNCEETGGVIVETGTTIKIVQGEDGEPMILHQGKEYKCAIVTDGSKTPDVVLDQSMDDVKVVLSDPNTGRDVEVKDGSVKVDAGGNAVVVDQKGVSVKLENGGVVEVSETGDVNINVPGSASVKTSGGTTKITTPSGGVEVNKAGDVDVNVPGTASVKTSGGAVEVNTPETGNIKIDADGGVSLPGMNLNF